MQIEEAQKKVEELSNVLAEEKAKTSPEGKDIKRYERRIEELEEQLRRERSKHQDTELEKRMIEVETC